MITPQLEANLNFVQSTKNDRTPTAQKIRNVTHHQLHPAALTAAVENRTRQTGSLLAGSVDVGATLSEARSELPGPARAAALSTAQCWPRAGHRDAKKSSFGYPLADWNNASSTRPPGW
jgi:hypothetical protein